MSPALGLAVLLPVTLAFLGGAVVTGLRARRRAHLAFVSGTVLALGAAVVFAARLGNLYDLEAAGWITPVHLFLARVATGGVLVVLTTGALTLHSAGRRPLHRATVGAFLLLVVLAAVTGLWMILAAERL